MIHRLVLLLSLSLGLVLGGCITSGKRSGSSSSGLGAQRVSVNVSLAAKAQNRGIDAFRKDLENSLTRRYKTSRSPVFREIRFQIERVIRDPSNRNDLILTGKLTTKSSRGTQSRTVERSIRGGANQSPSSWSGKFTTDLISAIDYQLRLMAP